MTRVGFRLIGGAAWQGGRNYLWNLLHAITQHTSLQPVLLVRPDEEPGDLAMPGVEVFATSERLDSARTRTLGRAFELVVRRNPIERAWLRKARIDVLSHAAPVGGVPTISWVPDVQHRHLPDLAPRRERMLRELFFREMVRDSTVLLASSEHAALDLRTFYNASDAKLRVLRFVSQPRLPADKMLALDALRAKHGIPARFIHLPNQLWKHKNHELVVEALMLAPEVTVVATGPTEDYRQAGLYDALMARVQSYGLADRFRHLGLVSFAELISLMHHSVAVVNPSRFEGWSSTVEEARSLGKRILVSDIPVHREQDPPRAEFFPVDSAAALAQRLSSAWATYDAAEDARAMAAAAAALPGRTRAFAEAYEAIVHFARNAS